MPLRNFFRRLYRSSDAQGQAGRRGDAARPDQASGVPLRCRPGDRAVFVRPMTMGLYLTGEEVVVVKPGTLTVVDYHDGELWVLREPIPVRANWSIGHSTGNLVAVGDEFLRPIRDPGEDAVDEILQKVGLPTFPLERQEA